MTDYWGAAAGNTDRPRGEDGGYFPTDQDPVPEYTAPPGDNNGDRIEMIYRQVMGERPAHVSALADQWQNAYDLLLHARNDLYGESNTLYNEHWSSGAARDAFMRYGPGATLANLDQWMTAVDNNVVSLRGLVSVIQDYQSQMTDLWQRYQGGLQDVRVLMQPDGVTPASDDSKMQATRDAQDQYSQEAQGLAYRMAGEYLTALGRVGTGHGPAFMPPNVVLNDPGHPTLLRMPSGPRPAPPAAVPPPAAAPPRAAAPPLPFTSPPAAVPPVPVAALAAAPPVAAPVLAPLAAPPPSAAPSPPVASPAAPPALGAGFAAASGLLAAAPPAGVLGAGPVRTANPAPPPAGAARGASVLNSGVIGPRSAAGGAFGSRVTGFAPTEEGLTGSRVPPALPPMNRSGAAPRSRPGAVAPEEAAEGGRAAPPGVLGAGRRRRPAAAGSTPAPIRSQAAGSPWTAGIGSAPGILSGHPSGVAGTAAEATRSGAAVVSRRAARGGAVPPLLDRGRSVPAGTADPAGTSPRRRTAARGPAVPGTDWFGAEASREGLPDPVLAAQGLAVDRTAWRLDEVPEALRGAVPATDPTTGSGASPAGADRSAARPATAGEPGQAGAAVAGPRPTPAHATGRRAAGTEPTTVPEEDGSRVITDEEAFTVDSPGGPVLREGHQERVVWYPANPGALGAR
jgi:hypothetical protein